MRDEREGEIADLFEQAIGRQVDAASKAIAAGDSVDGAFDGRGVEEAYRETWRRIAPLFAGAIYDAMLEAKGHDPELVVEWEEAVFQHIRESGGTQVALINNTTREFIRGQLTDGLERGLSPREVAREIRKVWNEESINGLTYGRNRAVRIARTEMLGASNFGNLIGAESTGLELQKVWLTAGDTFVRDRHARLQGQERPINQPFSNGLEYPGDPRGDAAEIVNCRCDMYFERQ